MPMDFLGEQLALVIYLPGLMSMGAVTGSLLEDRPLGLLTIEGLYLFENLVLVYWIVMRGRF